MNSSDSKRKKGRALFKSNDIDSFFSHTDFEANVVAFVVSHND